MSRATLPWETAGKPGRPKNPKPAARTQPSCAWPDRATGGTCRSAKAKGLALCAEHAKVLDEDPGETCAWPGCSQSAPFRALCTYHDKRALGLLEASR